MYPHERSLVKELADQPFALVGVNTDRDLDEIREVVKKKNIIWRSFYDRTGDITKQYGINAFPTVMLIDHEGVIRKIDPRNLDKEIEALIAKVN